MRIFLTIMCIAMFTGPVDNSYETKYGILEECFSQDEIDLICNVVESEASICTLDAKKNVVSVILNRYFSGWGGDSGIYGVCREGQFSHRKNEYSEDAYKALREVWLDGPTNDCYYFCRKKKDVFYGGHWIFFDGYHNYYGRH